MLASVANLDEARQVLAAGADIIDLKAPAAGVLGALPAERIREIVAAIAGQRPVSATTGDLPMDPRLLLDVAESVAASGVDFVKIGFFPGGDWAGTIQSLGGLARQGVRLIAVLLADQPIPADTLTQLAAAGFTGVMLDTQDKDQGPLTRCLAPEVLEQFVRQAGEHGLLSGLAGSLRAEDIPLLLALKPDYLGFRGALCQARQRTEALDAWAIARIRALIPASHVQPN